MPQASGDVITLKFGTPQVTDLTSLGLPNWLFPQTTFNASREPAMRSMVAPGGRGVASSDVIPSGINGLPPRDVQIQGLPAVRRLRLPRPQDRDHRRRRGEPVGFLDGVHSKSILVTKGDVGRWGTTPLNVPPVGTVMNFIDFSGGFGIADSVIPQKGTNLNSFQFVTPFGNIPVAVDLLATSTRGGIHQPF